MLAETAAILHPARYQPSIRTPSRSPQATHPFEAGTSHLDLSIATSDSARRNTRVSSPYNAKYAAIWPAQDQKQDQSVKSMSTRRSAPATNQPDFAANEIRQGTIYGFLAYFSWGVLPLYFHALSPASALEILSHRIVWSLVFCIILCLIRNDFSWVPLLFQNPRRLLLLTVAAVFLAINWGVYIYAVTDNNVVESSLGYFINPILLVLMGVIILKERLRRLQWAAVGLATVAVLIISIDYGRLPWIALALATSFATYGYIKKLVGANMDALPSMTIETVVLAPFAIATIVWIELSGDGTFVTEGMPHTSMLLSTGIITAVPLILFAAAARRVPLATMGLLQFLAPVLQFISGVFILGEDVPLSRWIGFSIVWVALAMLTTDIIRHTRTERRHRAPVPISVTPREAIQ